MNACYRRHNPTGGPAKIMAKISVEGQSGAVKSAQVVTPAFRGNAVGQCVEGVLRSMEFKPFQRPEYAFRVPFLVQ